MNEVTGDLFEFVYQCEPNDLKIGPHLRDSIEGGDGGDEEVDPMDKVFRKEYGTCVPVQVPSTGWVFLAIKEDWFTKFVGNEMREVRDCYIKKISKDHKHNDKIHGLSNTPVQGNVNNNEN